MTSEEHPVRVPQGSKYAFSSLDYVVSRGQYYEVVRNDFENEVYLKEVDEIPDEYKKRWDK